MDQPTLRAGRYRKVGGSTKGFGLGCPGGIWAASLLRLVGQANNVLIFPGVGLGAIVARAQEITDRMFLVAARTLAARIATSRLREGAIFPAIADLRSISRAVAVAVTQEAQRAGVAQMPDDADVETLVDIAMWDTAYQTVPRETAFGYDLIEPPRLRVNPDGLA